MGLTISTLFANLFNSTKEYRILMLGLDYAGKTTVLYDYKLGEVVTTIPTIGCNVETVVYRNISMTFLDPCSVPRMRPLWHHYFVGTQGLIFVVDSNDRGRFQEAAEELHRLLANDELSGITVLILANKQDLPLAASTADIADKLSLRSLRNPWYIQPCSATSQVGLSEGLDWLSTTLSDQSHLGK